MWVKQRNHRTETLLERWAEPFSVFAANLIKEATRGMAGGQEAPVATASRRLGNVSPILRQAWRLVMEDHPHDSICGCSIDQVHDEMRPRFDQADQIGEEIPRQALQALAAATDTGSNGAFSAIVLFNSLGSTHRDLVEVELSIPEGVAAFELVDENGAVLPHEFLSPSNVEVANLLLKKNDLRDAIGAVGEGRVAGAAIVRVTLSRQGAVATIDPVLLMLNAGRVLSREQLEQRLYAWGEQVESNAIEVHIHHLRRKLAAKLVRTVRGVGYLMPRGTHD